MKTNRDYFSWSQYYLWKSSKLQFYKRYVLGDDLRLDAFDKGKEFGEYKETGEIPHYCSDPLLEQVGSEVPSLDVMEHKLELMLGDIKLLMFLDSSRLDLTHFDEYKTGKNPWTQKMVNEHEQLDFYALGCYLVNGQTTIPTATLYWIETEEVEMPDGSKELRYTGKVEKFERTFTEEDIVNIGAKITQTVADIEAYEHVEIDIDENDAQRYVDLLQQEKEIKEELNLLKLKFFNAINDNDAKYGNSPVGKFSISERKTYQYTPDLLNKEADYKAEIDELKRQEKNSGTASIKISKSLRFTKSK